LLLLLLLNLGQSRISVVMLEEFLLQ